jgi:RNA polymerase sigma-70 factor, ECF subfamily
VLPASFDPESSATSPPSRVPTPQPWRAWCAEDLTLERMPSPTWFAGANALAGAVQGLGSPGDWRMLPITANGQPAAAAYLRGDDGAYQAYAIVVLSATTTGIARIVVFGEPGLFDTFGLPRVHVDR